MTEKIGPVIGCTGVLLVVGVSLWFAFSKGALLGLFALGMILWVMGYLLAEEQ